MLRFILIAVMVTVVTSDQLSAQSPQRRRGRFLQKLRDDIMGANKKQASSSKKSKSSKAPTPLAGGKSTSATGRNSNKPSTSFSISDRSSPTSGTRKVGFGFGVSANKSDQIIVTRLDRNGNGAAAGIRRGDQISEIGGIEANNVEEFDEIAKIMGAGDQMEFKIVRGGRVNTVTVQFGQQPTAAQFSASDRGNKSILQKPNDHRRYDFSPPRDGQAASNSIRSSSQPNLRAKPVSQQLTNQNESRQIQLMNRTIMEQNREIQQLQGQIRQMQRALRSR